MRKFFFLVVLAHGHSSSGGAPAGRAPTYDALLDVVQVSEAAARVALAERVKWELPGCTLVKAELAFSRCESLTEFIRKSAA